MSERVRKFFILKIFVLVFTAVSVLVPLTLREAQSSVLDKVRAKADYLKAIAKGGHYQDMFIAKAYSKLVDVLYHEALEHKDKIKWNGKEYYIQKIYTFDITLLNGKKTKLGKVYALTWYKVLKNKGPVENLKYSINYGGPTFYDQTYIKIGDNWYRLLSKFSDVFIKNNKASLDLFTASVGLKTKIKIKYYDLDNKTQILNIGVINTKAAEKIREEYGY